LLISPSCAEKQHKRVDKYIRLDASASQPQAPAHDLKAALAQIRLEPIPQTVEAREKYFLESVALGEQLCARGKSSSLYHIMLIESPTRIVRQ
jgi:MAS20 protein import receptor